MVEIDDVHVGHWQHWRLKAQKVGKAAHAEELTRMIRLRHEELAQSRKSLARAFAIAFWTIYGAIIFPGVAQARCQAIAQRVKRTALACLRRRQLT
jgi:hypothetical protein